VLDFYVNKCVPYCALLQTRINCKVPVTKKCVWRYQAQLQRELEAVLWEKEELAKKLDSLRSKLEAANDDKNRSVHTKIVLAMW
jgi:hypothetical protein